MRSSCALIRRRKERDRVTSWRAPGRLTSSSKRCARVRTRLERGSWDYLELSRPYPAELSMDRHYWDRLPIQLSVVQGLDLARGRFVDWVTTAELRRDFLAKVKEEQWYGLPEWGGEDISSGIQFRVRSKPF